MILRILRRRSHSGPVWSAGERLPARGASLERGRRSLEELGVTFPRNQGDLGGVAQIQSIQEGGLVGTLHLWVVDGRGNGKSAHRSFFCVLLGLTSCSW